MATTNYKYQQRYEDLTNLNWLTDLKRFHIFTNINKCIKKHNKYEINLPAIRFNKFLNAVQVNRDIFIKNRNIYMNNTIDKPPFNYAHLIAMALVEMGRLTLQDICKWIKLNFGYYRKQNNWNNSIRHNLSLSMYFVKVARQENDKGKGGYWELTMSSKKRRKKRQRINKCKNIKLINNDDNNNNDNNKNDNNNHLNNNNDNNNHINFDNLNDSCDEFLVTYLNNNEQLSGPNVIVQHLPYSTDEMILKASGTQLPEY